MAITYIQTKTPRNTTSQSSLGPFGPFLHPKSCLWMDWHEELNGSRASPWHISPPGTFTAGQGEAHLHIKSQSQRVICIDLWLETTCRTRTLSCAQLWGTRRSTVESVPQTCPHTTRQFCYKPDRNTKDICFREESPKQMKNIGARNSFIFSYQRVHKQVIADGG